MNSRRLPVLLAAGALAVTGLLAPGATTAAGAAPARGGPALERATTVLLRPMVAYRSTRRSWPARSDRRRAVAAASRLANVRVVLPAQTSAERRSALARARVEAQARWRVQRGLPAFKTSRIYGDCGWSEVTLENATGDNIGYAAARFSLNRPGYAYRVNIHVWDTSAFDFSAWDFPDTGTLGGGRSYADSFTFRVDENGDYGAQLNRGDVYVGGSSWCVTGGPRVDNVRIV